MIVIGDDVGNTSPLLSLPKNSIDTSDEPRRDRHYRKTTVVGKPVTARPISLSIGVGVDVDLGVGAGGGSDLQSSQVHYP